MYLTAITAAEGSMDIEAAYFIPDPLMNVFECDLESSRRYTYSHWRDRGWSEKAAEIVLIPIRSQF